MRRAAFTLVETLAVLLVLTLAIGSAVAVLRMATRISDEGLARTSASVTAQCLLLDPSPCGLTADINDTDGDGWRGAGTFAWSGGYTLVSSGLVNGYWGIRTETSQASDILAPTMRKAVVEVEVFLGLGGRRVAWAKEPALIRQEAP